MCAMLPRLTTRKNKMHSLEPFYRWRDFYVASEDSRSPFFERQYSEFEYTNAIYNHLIHPQWDDIGSPSLFLKVLYTDYGDGFTIIEFLGEWNDLLHSDIMTLVRDYLELMIEEGIFKFILLGENVLNFHGSDDCYYEEWYDSLVAEDGWIALVNFRKHVLDEMCQTNIDQYMVCGGKLNEVDWRTKSPDEFYQKVAKQVNKRLGI